MENNLTPAKIVEMYLPEYEKRFVSEKDNIERCYVKSYRRYPMLSEVKNIFHQHHFPEALAERDRILCEEQREICLQAYKDAVLHKYNTYTGICIRHAFMPKLKEE